MVVYATDLTLPSPCEAADLLGEIIGASPVVDDALLDRIFNQFCIGKSLPSSPGPYPRFTSPEENEYDDIAPHTQARTAACLPD